MLTGVRKFDALPPPSLCTDSSSGMDALRDARMSTACHSPAPATAARLGGPGGVLGVSGTSGHGEVDCDCDAHIKVVL